MTDKRPIPPKKTAGRKGQKAPPLNLPAIKTLIVVGHSLSEISLMLGKNEKYLQKRSESDPELAKVIADAREEHTDGFDYEMVEQLAAQGNTQDQISAAMGYSSNYISNRKKNDPKLKEALERGQAKGVLQVTNALFQSAINGNLGAQCFYLKNRAGWKDRFDIDANTSHQHFYMEGRPEAEDIDSWQQQFSPTQNKPTVQ